MLNRKLFFLISSTYLLWSTSAISQCNITPDLSGTAVNNQQGNNNDYIVVCTQGASTGALVVQNGISSNFLSFFNNYSINWGIIQPLIRPLQMFSRIRQLLTYMQLGIMF